jgi:hypothetical protein
MERKVSWFAGRRVLQARPYGDRVSDAVLSSHVLLEPPADPTFSGKAATDVADDQWAWIKPRA